VQPIYILVCLLLYFAFLLLVSYLTSKKVNNEGFFLANRKSPWYLIAFGMIGSSISGVTFISVPGSVNTDAFSYFQMILGNVLGFWLIAGVLMPIYYRLNLTSIYTYLDTRFGKNGYKTGAVFFLISRITGAAFRLYIAIEVLQLCVFDTWHVPFIVSSVIVVFMIWLYTFRGGMKTIIWTDALQTFFLLSALAGSIYLIAHSLQLNLSELVNNVTSSHLSQVFFWDIKDKRFFGKQCISGIFIAIAMTGLDQDMMQKNLTCKTLKEAQKNIFSFSIVFSITVFLFLILGVMLYMFVSAKGISIPSKPDELYPFLATKGYFGIIVAFIFIMGLTAASFASADSAMAALTTSFCVDILNVGKNTNGETVRKLVHAGMAVVLILVIVIFRIINNPIIIHAVFTAAGYTYGPLLGLYSLGILTKYKPKDKLIPWICIASPLLTFFIQSNSETWFGGYKFGYEILMLNALITFIGLFLVAKTIRNEQTGKNLIY
jgi:Na+/proline symporter